MQEMHNPLYTAVEPPLVNHCFEPRTGPKLGMVDGFSGIRRCRIFLSLMPVVIALRVAAAQTGVNEASVALPWQVTQRDFHSSTWESVVPIVDPISGQTNVQRHKFVSIGSGINFL